MLESFEKRFNLTLGERLAIGIEFHQYLWQFLLKFREDALKFSKALAKSANTLQVF
jgi:hypothetical protein